MGGVLHVTAFLVETQNTILNLKMRIICLLKYKYIPLLSAECIAFLFFVITLHIEIDSHVYVQAQSHSALLVHGSAFNSVHPLPKWNHNIICVPQEPSSGMSQGSPQRHDRGNVNVLIC